MGLLDGLLGNASEIDASEIEGDFAQVMAPGAEDRQWVDYVEDAEWQIPKRSVSARQR